MKLNLTTLSALIALLTVTGAGVQAHTHIGSDLPALGDVAAAGKLDKAGDVAAEAGQVQEAVADYQAAVAASPFDENAALGLGHCAAEVGDFKDSIYYYRKAIYGHGEDYDIDLQTEYILVLSQAGQGQEAVSLYDHVADLCKNGYAVNKLDVPLPVFRLDGSDYDPARLQAMTHLIRAINSSNGDEKRVTTEIQKAKLLAPASDVPVISFYEGVLQDQVDKTNVGVVSDQMSKTNAKAGSHQANHQIATASSGKTVAAAKERLKMIP